MKNKDLKEYKIKPPSKYKFTKIIDDLYWARLPLPFRLDHVNIFAINSVEGLVIVDTGLNNFETMTCWNSICLLYTSPSPRDKRQSRMPSSA